MLPLIYYTFFKTTYLKHKFVLLLLKKITVITRRYNIIYRLIRKLKIYIHLLVNTKKNIYIKWFNILKEQQNNIHNKRIKIYNMYTKLNYNTYIPHRNLFLIKKTTLHNILALSTLKKVLRIKKEHHFFYKKKIMLQHNVSLFFRIHIDNIKKKYASYKSACVLQAETEHILYKKLNYNTYQSIFFFTTIIQSIKKIDILKKNVTSHIVLEYKKYEKHIQMIMPLYIQYTYLDNTCYYNYITNICNYNLLAVQMHALPLCMHKQKKTKYIYSNSKTKTNFLFKKKKIYIFFQIIVQLHNIFLNITNAHGKVKKSITLGRLGFFKAKKKAFYCIIELSNLLKFFFFHAVKHKRRIIVQTIGKQQKIKIILRKILNPWYLRHCYHMIHHNIIAHNGTKKKKKPRK